MQVTQDPTTGKYVCFNSRGDWFPASDTMHGAIQAAISVMFYWSSLKGVRKLDVTCKCC